MVACFGNKQLGLTNSNRVPTGLSLVCVFFVSALALAIIVSRLLFLSLVPVLCVSALSRAVFVYGLPVFLIYVFSRLLFLSLVSVRLLSLLSRLLLCLWSQRAFCLSSPACHF